MKWVLLAVLLVVLAALVTFLVIRFNQLSMNRSLTAEALRQYTEARRARHGLVPTYLIAAREVVGDSVETHRLESAVRAAGQSEESRATGPAEFRLTLCVAAVHARVRSVASGEGERPTASRALARELFQQLRTQETHIGAAARHHNSSVRAYEDRRRLLGSLPWRWAFRPVAEIGYSLADAGDDDAAGPSADLVSADGGEDYRPGRLSEDL
jgi:hypothetical protein